MKKSILAILLCACLFGTSSCLLLPRSTSKTTVNTNKSVNDIGQTDASDEGAVTIIEETQATEKKADVTVEEQVLIEQDGVKITLKSFDTTNIFGPALKLLIENSGEKSVTIQTRNSAINGLMVASMLSCDIESGKKANDELIFMSSDLEASGIEKIKDIEFSFTVFDTETWDNVFDSDTVNITTSLDSSFVQSYDDTGFVAFEQDGYKVVIKRLESETSFWGADIYAYIENNSEQDVTIQTRNMSVNGFMIDPMFSCDVLAGKKAFTTLTFMESDLTDNDIESIETLEFNFTIVDANSWDTIVDSDTITVSFE